MTNLSLPCDFFAEVQLVISLESVKMNGHNVSTGIVEIQFSNVFY